MAGTDEDELWTTDKCLKTGGSHRAAAAAVSLGGISLRVIRSIGQHKDPPAMNGGHVIRKASAGA